MLGIPVVVSNKGSGHCPGVMALYGRRWDQPSVEKRQYWGIKADKETFHRISKPKTYPKRIYFETPQIMSLGF
jgi:hypothetical protein